MKLDRLIFELQYQFKKHGNIEVKIYSEPQDILIDNQEVLLDLAPQATIIKLAGKDPVLTLCSAPTFKAMIEERV